jgi:uncharacterized protein (TIGR02246 family)
MSAQQDLAAAENLVTQYAEAVNAADRQKIASLYSEDGLFMPAGMRSLTKNEITKKGKQKGDNNHFRMSYDINNIVIGDKYAFVEAHATTNTINREKDTHTTRTSRDLFVLRKDGGDWRVYRYMFNYAQV